MKTNARYETLNHHHQPTKRRAWIGPGRWATGLLLSLLLAAAVTAAPGNGPRVGGKRGVETINMNLYVGGGIGRVMALNPADPAYVSNLVFTVTGVFYEIVASDPATRLNGVADEIAARRPDLVAVQEASLIRNQSPGDLVVGGTQPATNVVYDYLAILVNALEARGAHYAVVACTEEADVEMPMFNLQTGTIDDARLTDRDAILVRTDLPPGQLHVSNPQGGHFTNRIELPTVTVLRGWCSVDVFIRGENLRYVCAHLEEETAPQIQMGQAVELLASLADVGRPVILSGDFNADPLQRNGVATYDAFAAAGFDDAWGVVNAANPTGGLTWGHDELLADPTVPFIWRLDLVLFRGCGLTPTQSEVLDLGLDRAQPPFWSSDHAALTADFRIAQPHTPKPPTHGRKVGAPIRR